MVGFKLGSMLATKLDGAQVIDASQDQVGEQLLGWPPAVAAAPRARTAAARPQGPAAHDVTARGSPVARVAVCKGDCWQERPPARKVSPDGSSAATCVGQ
ncbi:hypothetical protein BHM03_00062424 [Ensete ventricosum]|nr:hypothetical protein BHM03_00062424 [Ensete ventricosum]